MKKIKNFLRLFENMHLIPEIMRKIDNLSRSHESSVDNIPYWPDIESTLKLHLTPSDIVFDIGANQGVYTKIFAEITKKVYAFEPNPEMVKILRSKSFPTNVDIYELAMSNREGVATFYIDIREGVGAVASSLLELDDLKASNLIRPIEVRTSTIDSFVSTGPVPTFIKIDVEGFEPEVLTGAKNTIEKHLPIIIFEMWENHWERFQPIFLWLSRTHYLIRVANGVDALDFYTNNRANGGADILAIPLKR